MSNALPWETHCILYACIALAERLEEEGADATELVQLLKAADEKIHAMSIESAPAAQ